MNEHVNSDGTIRRIEDSQARFGDKSKVETYDWNTKLGPKGIKRVVDKHLLKIDGQYQRRGSLKKARAIAREFYWPAFGCLTVSKRKDGSCFVMDGGHRALATMMRPDIDEVPCYVFEGLTREQEAWAFVRINKNRRPPQGTELFAAEITAGDPEAHRLKEILDKHHISVGRHSSNGEMVLRCPRTAKEMLETLSDVLDFITLVWPDDDKALNSAVLKGVDAFRSRLQKQMDVELLDGDVLERFEHVGLTAIYQRSMGIRSFGGRSTYDAFADAMVEAWNKGRRSRRIPIAGDA
jgi:hypothetical protein